MVAAELELSLNELVIGFMRLRFPLAILPETKHGIRFRLIECKHPADRVDSRTVESTGRLARF